SETHACGERYHRRTTPQALKPSLDHAVRRQRIHLVLAEPEHFCEHPTRVLSEEWWRRVVGDRGGGEAHRTRDRGTRHTLWVRDLDPQSAMTHLGILEHLLEIVDRPAWNAGCSERCDPVAARSRAHGRV